MQELIEVEFRTGRLGYYPVNPDLDISPEDLIIVEVERGDDIAQVIHMSVCEEDLEPLPAGTKYYSIRRKANAGDIERLNNLGIEEEKAAKTFNSTLERYPFAMKLIETIYQYDGNKLTFFFTAEGRIDFRTFVRELATLFKTRIELHQTTGRDEARRLGGFGMCGKQYCCGNFLKHFNQVTIKMAKDQNLAGNLSKISGPCGRLLCCLNFEEDFYMEESRDFPLIGTVVKMDGSPMVVYRFDVLSKRIYLSSEDGAMVDMDAAQFEKLEIISKPELEPC